MDLCQAESALQAWRLVKPAKRTGLQGYLIKSDRFDLCVDGSELAEKGLVGRRCDIRLQQQRFMFQYKLL